MKYKALIMDLDGTAIIPGRPSATPAVVRALKAARKKGVVLIAATGRASFAAAGNVLGIRPDYGVYANGACVLDGAGRPIYEDRFTEQQMYTLVDFCEDYEYPLAFSFEDSYYAYVEYEHMRHDYAVITGHDEYITDGRDEVRHLQSMPYTAFMIMPPAAVEQYNAKYPGLRITPYDADHYDVFKPENTKADGLRHLLDAIGIRPEETVAVGDGANDVEMLQLAGLGVAMDNASDPLKAMADMVAPSVREDGLATLVQQLFLQN